MYVPNESLVDHSVEYQQDGVYVATGFLPDGRNNFRVVEVGTDAPGLVQDVPTARANGQFEGADLLLPSTVSIVRYAALHGLAMKIGLHDSPVTGLSAYAPARKAERFGKVVATMAPDGPVRLEGHSAGGPQVTAVGTDRVSDGLPITSVLYNSPNGFTPARPKHLPRSIGDVVSLGFKIANNSIEEIEDIAELWRSSPQAREMLRATGKDARRHVTSNPVGALFLAGVLLSHDILPATKELHGKIAIDGISRMRVLAGKRDVVCPSQPMRKRWVAAGLPEADFKELDATHVGPIADPGLEHVPDIFHAMTLSDRDDSIDLLMSRLETAS